MQTITYSVKYSLWKRLSMAGFAFFLAKGLLWLALPVVMYFIGGTG